jgi:hypothetical protein
MHHTTTGGSQNVMHEFTYRLLVVTFGMAIVGWFVGAWGILLANADSSTPSTSGLSSIKLFEVAASGSRSSYRANRFDRLPDFTVWQSPKNQVPVEGTTSLQGATDIISSAIGSDVGRSETASQ